MFWIDRRANLMVVRSRFSKQLIRQLHLNSCCHRIKLTRSFQWAKTNRQLGATYVGIVASEPPRL